VGSQGEVNGERNLEQCHVMGYSTTIKLVMQIDPFYSPLDCRKIRVLVQQVRDAEDNLEVSF